MMKKVATLLVLSLLLFGCTSTENALLEKVKKDPQVQDFFKTYPDAKVTFKQLKPEDLKGISGDINQLCGKQLPLDYYDYVQVDHSDVIHLIVIIQRNSEKPSCVSAKGRIYEEVFNPGKPDKELMEGINKVCKDARYPDGYSTDVCIRDFKARCDTNPGVQPIDECYKSASEYCNAQTPSGLCNADLAGIRNGIEDKGADNPNTEQRIQKHCPGIYNPELKKLCPDIVRQYSSFRNWFFPHYLDVLNPKPTTK